MIYFLDTSALAKRYLNERGSSRIRRLLDGKEHVFYQAFITPIEFASAIYRRLRARELVSDQVATLLRAYVAHSNQEYLFVPHSESLMDRAAALVAHHALRTLDALQLACALELRSTLPLQELPVCFIGADDRLLGCARHEHLQVINAEKW